MEFKNEGPIAIFNKQIVFPGKNVGQHAKHDFTKREILPQRTVSGRNRMCVSTDGTCVEHQKHYEERGHFKPLRYVVEPLIAGDRYWD